MEQLTKEQYKKYVAFCKKHNIVGFGGMSYEAPCISLDIFAGKKVFITERSISGHNIGVHSSVEGDTDVVSVWCGAGWCLFGKKFVDALTKEFQAMFPELGEYTEGYDKVASTPNYVKVFATVKDKKKAQ